ncbi:MAG: ATP-binding cassette domain-containing protein [Nitrospirae bacterium]|nr:ATP-binding cassette domain-containing protein [Fimbriimonadaceae bacterium]
MSDLVRLIDVTKSFAGLGTRAAVPAVTGLSLDIREGDFLTIFGPNGCGKTTVLRLIARLLTPDSGQILYASQGGPLEVGCVFQNYADTLLPWRTVRGNASRALEYRRIPRHLHDSIVRPLLEQFQLDAHADKYVCELSGGLKQLTSIVSALVQRPRLLLLDEPFSAVDYVSSRVQWIRFREYCALSGTTAVLVSHNLDEAVFLGDRIAVLGKSPDHPVTVLDISLAGARKLDMLRSEEFFHMRNEVLGALNTGATG